MGQGDIYDLLKSKPNRWFSSDDIYNTITHISRGSLCISIGRLVKGNVVDVKTVKLRVPRERGKNRNYVRKIKYKND